MTKHSTDLYMVDLKNIITKYCNLNARMFLCLNTSKSFHRVDYAKLLHKLLMGRLDRITNLKYRYMPAKLWWVMLSQSFTVTNGVRKGGILSPFLFYVYMDDLST